jgi:hypothetical protein
MRKSKRTVAQSVDIEATAPKARAIAWLRDHGSPRLVMSLMLACTMGCGFLASVAMHRVGLSAPLIRYPLVVLVAWGVFLFLVGVWVWWHRRANAAHVDTRDIGNQQPFYWSDIAGAGTSAEAGTSAGAPHDHRASAVVASNAATQLAHRTTDAVATESTRVPVGTVVGSNFENDSSVVVSKGSRKGGSDNWNFNFDGDDAGFVLLFIGIVAVALAVFGVVFYAVYSAPVFFAELLIDGGVGTWLYKRADVVNHPDALTTAIKRSVWPVAILIAMFIGLASVMRYVAPEATTLSEAWHVAHYDRR